MDGEASAGDAYSTPHDDESLGLSFREEQWLNTRPLSVGTVMDYFRLSPWYDPGSINARAIEQGLAPEAASRLTGMEYRVCPQPTQAQGLIVLEAWRRSGPKDSDVELMALYYCLWGTIYQAPDIRSVLAGRARRAAVHIHKAMALIAECSLPAVEAPAPASRKRRRAGAADGPAAAEGAAAAGVADVDDEEGGCAVPGDSEGVGGGASAPLALLQGRLSAQDAALVGASISAAMEGELASIVAARRSATQRTGAVRRAADGAFRGTEEDT
ncbi:hypothetical protein FNF27_01060 [Cafeteria roenbergensis]|uniref:Mediator of RNA polymerase II transcription subunit 6 n=2 Tax=Cafeteria roenbergensis TaxID=33653 RepID=A0A5A8EI97_CAFRO|nr:hypothetical protein FNF27_01060 [Cafeteria roenbergensis]